MTEGKQKHIQKNDLHSARTADARVDEESTVQQNRDRTSTGESAQAIGLLSCKNCAVSRRLSRLPGFRRATTEFSDPPSAAHKHYF